jgi:hypothetical protein
MSEPISGTIRADELYTLTELKRRLGIEDRAWWNMKADGIRVAKIGTRACILGSEILKWAEANSHAITGKGHSPRRAKPAPAVD